MKFLLRLFVAAEVCLASLFSVELKAQTMPDFWWQCDEGDTTYNFHPATNFYQHNASDLRGHGWNVSTLGVSIGSKIILGGSFGVSHTWVW